MYKLPELHFKKDELGDFLSAETIDFHYGKHHQNYINKLNEAIEKYPEYSSLKIEDLMKKVNELPDEIRQTVINNGGGTLNHNIYWENISVEPDLSPSEKMLADINSQYGSFEKFGDEFMTKAALVFGSGWLWIMPDLTILASVNQENPISNTGVKPLAGIDVWEHAYYIDYRNARPDYIKQWWRHLDWNKISKKYSDLAR